MLLASKTCCSRMRCLRRLAQVTGLLEASQLNKTPKRNRSQHSSKHRRDSLSVEVALYILSENEESLWRDTELRLSNT